MKDSSCTAILLPSHLTHHGARQGSSGLWVRLRPRGSLTVAACVPAEKWELHYS